jgi:hypothetical protein
MLFWLGGGFQDEFPVWKMILMKYHDISGLHADFKWVEGTNMPIMCGYFPGSEHIPNQ